MILQELRKISYLKMICPDQYKYFVSVQRRVIILPLLSTGLQLRAASTPNLSISITIWQQKLLIGPLVSNKEIFQQ